MDNKRFNDVIVETMGKCMDTLGVKANEYATEDRLHNFKVAAEIQNCTPMTALAGMMAKHTVISGIEILNRLDKEPLKKRKSS